MSLFIVAKGKGVFYLSPGSSHELTNRVVVATQISNYTRKDPSIGDMHKYYEYWSHSAQKNSQMITADGENHLCIFLKI